MRIARAISAMLFVALVVGVSGCATAVNGKTQEVSFSSNPAGAVVFVDGANVGTTPTTVKLTRHDPHSVRIEKPGYIAYELTTTSSDNDEAAKDYLPLALFPPLILVAIPVDRYLGGAYAIHPDDISAQLISRPANPTATTAPSASN
jgi:hypothetical protein